MQSAGWLSWLYLAAGLNDVAPDDVSTFHGEAFASSAELTILEVGR